MTTQATGDKKRKRLKQSSIEEAFKKQRILANSEGTAGLGKSSFIEAHPCFSCQYIRESYKNESLMALSSFGGHNFPLAVNMSERKTENDEAQADGAGRHRRRLLMAEAAEKRYFEERLVLWKPSTLLKSAVLNTGFSVCTHVSIQS